MKSLLVMGSALLAMPAWAGTSSCPDGIGVPHSAVESVDDLFRIRSQHSGQQVNFDGIELASADFTGRNFSDICFSNSKFPKSNWSGATGNNLQFILTDLTGSQWRRFRGQNLRFSGANLENATLAHAVMTRVRFDLTRLEGFDASHADLSGGSLRGNALNSLRRAKFDSANLTGFEFRCGIGQEDNCGQSSEEVSLAGANLTNAAILMASKSDWDFTNALIDNTRMHFFQLDWIRGSRIEGAVIVEPTAWTPASYNYSELLKPVTLSDEEIRIVWRAIDRLHEPGFDCEKAQSAAERYICSKSPYSEYARFAEVDRELNQAYVLAWRRDRSIINSQRLWLRHRDECMNLEASDFGSPGYQCMQSAYRDRIEELWQIAGMEAVLGPGERQFFVDQNTGEFLWEIEDRSLRAKLAPLALGNSWDLIIVERNPQSRLMANGESVGSNYHLGNLSSPEGGMVFDAKSGFYGASDPCLPDYDVCPIVRFRGYYLDTAPESIPNRDTGEYHFNDFISSGARAGFVRLVALPI
ncbi:pentapeptide repeat-containing protein [Altererythrobacter sp.]|uniref:pentapeptide repeat-containing protein n=1 Tax=Altererythrobacter sp. TaxID=1872480 RepID=UPI003D032C43